MRKALSLGVIFVESLNSGKRIDGLQEDTNYEHH